MPYLKTTYSCIDTRITYWALLYIRLNKTKTKNKSYGGGQPFPKPNVPLPEQHKYNPSMGLGSTELPHFNIEMWSLQN